MSTLEQRELIPEIVRLCEARQYDAAIKLTNAIAYKDIAIKAHLLVMEHEQAYKRANHYAG